MKLEKQVCSLELAKKLKDLGVEQDSLWWWIKAGKGLIDKQTYALKELMRPDDTDCSAFTVAELGELLFESDLGGFNGGKTRIHVETGKEYYCELGIHNFYSDTEANARAKMLIYLLEQGLTK